VVMVMRKLVKIEDVKMADARNEEGGDGDEEDHGEEDGSDGDSEDDDANSTASSTTFNIFDPSPHLPRPVPTSFLHASLHTPKTTTPEGATKLSPLGFYPGISLSRRTTPNSALQSLDLIVYPFQLVPTWLGSGGGTCRFFHPKRPNTPNGVFAVFSCGGDDGGQGEGTDGVWDIGWWVGSVLASSPVSLI